MPSHSSVRNRPQDFGSVVGQGKITGILANDIVRGDAHHLVLTGPSGSGKTTIGLIDAQALLCLTPAPSGSPCHRCDACMAFQRGANPDLRKISCPNQGSKENIEFLVEQFLWQTPYMSRNRVLLLDEAQALSLQAQEMLLDVMQAHGIGAICIFTLIAPDALIVPLRDRARVFQLDPPDFELSVTYLEHLGRTEGIEAEPEALKLIAAYSHGYRKLAEALDLAADYGGGGRVTAEVVRSSLLRDRSQGMLDFLGLCAAGDLGGQLDALKAMNLSAPEKVTGILEVLKHLQLRFVGPTRVRGGDARLTLLLPDGDCQQVVSAFAARAAELGRTAHGLFDEMLEYWLALPSVIDDSRLEGHVLRFHQLLLLGTAPADQDRAPARLRQEGQVRPAVPPAKTKWRMRDRAGIIDRRGDWLTLAQARESHEAATFLAQQHGKPFNARLTVDHAKLGRLADDAAAERISDLLRQLRARYFERSAKRHGPAFDLHRIAIHERGKDGALLSTILFHLPQDIDADVHAWLAKWAARFGEAAAVVLDCAHPENPLAAMGRQWELMRFLWGGLDPASVMDGLAVLDILQAPRSLRRRLGAIQCRRINLSLSIGDQAQLAASLDRMPHLSAWGDRHWQRLFTGWEMREHKDRTEEIRRRAARIEELQRSYSTSDAALEQTALNQALAAEQASWPVHPHDRPRKWRVWWEDDGATADIRWAS